MHQHADPTTLIPHRWSTADYVAMIDAGVLEGRNVELIDGMICDMSPTGPRHYACLLRLIKHLGLAPERALCGPGGTLIVSEGQVFDPDMMLLRPRDNDYADALPTPADVLLLIEVSDSSLRRDANVKLPIYAAAGVVEYWIADLSADVLVVHRDADGDRYRDVRTLRGDDRVCPAALPELSLRVGDLFQ